MDSVHDLSPPARRRTAGRKPLYGEKLRLQPATIRESDFVYLDEIAARHGLGNRSAALRFILDRRRV